MRRHDPLQVAHETSRRIAGVMGLVIDVGGEVPASGLIVCNHLGYLDVVVLAAQAPCVFVARRDAREWPGFGWFLRRMGCIYAERESRSNAGRTAAEIRAALSLGRRVVLFPEGTSSGGASVLPFQSPLLETAVGRPVAAAALGYRLDPGEGDPSEEVCYWRDMAFVPHLLRLLGKRRIHAALRVESFEAVDMDRKELARELRRRVDHLRSPAAARPARRVHRLRRRDLFRFSRHALRG